MSTVRELHENAADLVRKATVARREGDPDRAAKLTRQAFEFEERAAELVPDTQESEPTRSILLLSAASLAHQSHEPGAALRLIAKGLCGNPPPRVERDLRELESTIGFVKTIQAFAQNVLANKARHALVDQLAVLAGKAGLSHVMAVIGQLRSDAKLRKQIGQALGRAAERWAIDYEDRDLVRAVAEDTAFADLPAVGDAVRAIAERPFDPMTRETVEGKLKGVLPSLAPVRIERGVAALLEMLRGELAGTEGAQLAQQVAIAIEMRRDVAEIVTLLKLMLEGPTPTDETLHNYLNLVIDQHRYLVPRGVLQTTRQVQVPLEDVYVSLRAEPEPALSETDRRFYERELELLLRRDDLQPEEKEDLREHVLAAYLPADRPRLRRETMELSDLVTQHTALVVLGDPGAGKTTVLRHLALRHAQALRRGEAHVDGLGPTQLPLYFRIATFAQHGGGRNLLDFVPECIRGEGNDEEALRRLVRDKLGEGGCLVLFDGLDAVVEPNQRAEIASQIGTFIRAHEPSGNRFVVTSRVAGYRTAPLPGEIAHFSVRDLEMDQIEQFVRRWCQAVVRFQTPELSPEAQADRARAEIDGIIGAIRRSPGVRSLASNPLLLRTLALIHRTGVRLPERRVELYRLAADTLIRDWELDHGGPQRVLVHEAEATRLLSDLAAWMHEDKPLGIATLGEVRERLSGSISRVRLLDPDHPDVLVAVDEFLDRICQQTGLLVERAPRRFGFTHLAFEEYFAARWLVARPREASRRIRANLYQDRWREPILLAIALYGTEFPDDVDGLIEEAILGTGLGGPSPYEEVLHRDLLFAVGVMVDQEVGGGLRHELVSQFVQYWLEAIQAEGPARRYFDAAAEPLRGSLAALLILDHLVAALHDRSEDVRSSAASALQGATANPEVVSALLTALQDQSDDVRSRAAQALTNATANPEVVSALLAALQDPSHNVRSSAAQALSNATANPKVVSALLAALEDPNDNVRSSAAYALSSATLSTEAVSLLLAAVQDQSDIVRRGVANTLSDATDNTEVVSALLAAVQDPSDTVRRSAAYALSDATDNTEVVSALLATARDQSHIVRRSAAYALGDATANHEVVSTLVAALEDQSYEVRSSAAFALRNATVNREVLSALLAALRDWSEDVRSSAAYALRSATANPEVVPALLAALQDPSENVRRNAAHALGNAAPSADVVSLLTAALQDQSDDVRSSAAYALSIATPTAETVSLLSAALQDQSDDVRSSAAYALSSATGNQEVLSALSGALQDQSESVRRSAARALALISWQTAAVSVAALSASLATALELLRTSGPPRVESYPPHPRRELFQTFVAVAPRPTVQVA